MSLKEKVTTLLSEADRDILNEFFHSEIGDTTTWDSDEVTTFRVIVADQGISFEHVDNYGGEEMGREYWSVYKFSDGADTVHVQFDGWYASYDGSYYEEWFFVKPVEVMKIEFARVK